MYNAGKVIIFIVVLILFFTIPMWLNLGRVEAIPKPELPKDKAKCIESKEYMRAYHMKLLDDWRKQAIRENKHVYVAKDGEKYFISLQKTCMKCHNNKEKFCDSCHNFVVTHQDCWSCHIAPEVAEKWQ
ncbi:sulfate reduction electron transfer complex DsrMKJOP subunit DsrJ [Thermodesulfobacterium thermophilum]|uniref:sulfate reduction electron transfer complex DsrMKJOP subunit DsrJ n=1 Tax=Thermodesulfobacterium thermophilum TaxID=886 RepID=UPI0003B7A8DA|nr:sulfate reduction electron transfer complex DsrMKJOP subunit DsrJ [Thermodesulfobacterium thermophilum]